MKADSAAIKRAPAPPLCLHIDRLVLDNFAFTGRHAREQLQAAVQAELEALFASGGLHPELRGGVALPTLATAEMHLRHGAAPAQIGRQIARALYRGIGR